MATTGVFPVHENKFKIGTAGRSSAITAMKPISNLETFSVSIDGNIEEWKPMEDGGWVRRMKTGGSLTISLTGKRDIGDPGNDYVAGIAFDIGSACESKFEWELPSGAKLAFDCIINVTNPGSGESTNVAALECEVQSCGKPTYTPPAA